MKAIFQLSILFVFLLACNSTTTEKIKGSDKVLSPEKENCIKQILAQDSKLGTIRNHACEEVSLSQSIKDYVAGMQALNFNDCPPAFTKAFQRHQDAWTEMLVVSDQFPELRGEMHDLFDKIEASDHAETFKQLLKSVWDTWGGVEEASK